MVAERKPTPDLSYEEQVAVARANLQRNIAETLRIAAEWEAEHGDPQEALFAHVRKTFDRDALLHAWKEWRAERGKPELEGW